MQTLLLYTDRPSIKAPPYAISHIWPIPHGTCVICNGPYVYTQQVEVVYISTRYSMTLQTGGNVSINYWHMCILRPGKWFSHWYTWDMFGICLGYLWDISPLLGFCETGLLCIKEVVPVTQSSPRSITPRRKEKSHNVSHQCSATCTKVTLFPIIALYNGNGWEKKCGHLFMVLI